MGDVIWRTRISCPRCERYWLEYLTAYSVFSCGGCGRLPCGVMMPPPSSMRMKINPHDLERPAEIKTTGEIGHAPGMLPPWVVGVDEVPHD
jgi:hypothetical protein